MLIDELFKEMGGSCVTQQEYQTMLVEASGKMILLDKMLTKFAKEGKKTLIFSQFT
jgi:SNF2 family DNA or RNA helicase